MDTLSLLRKNGEKGQTTKALDELPIIAKSNRSRHARPPGDSWREWATRSAGLSAFHRDAGKGLFDRRKTVEWNEQREVSGELLLTEM